MAVRAAMSPLRPVRLLVARVVPVDQRSAVMAATAVWVALCRHQDRPLRLLAASVAQAVLQRDPAMAAQAAWAVQPLSAESRQQQPAASAVPVAQSRPRVVQARAALVVQRVLTRLWLARLAALAVQVVPVERPRMVASEAPAA